MTPQEKAKELVYKFYNEIKYMERAKECALIAVDEVIKSNPIIPLEYMLESEALDAAREFWGEVKTEIEKL